MGVCGSIRVYVRMCSYACVSVEYTGVYVGVYGSMHVVFVSVCECGVQGCMWGYTGVCVR